MYIIIYIIHFFIKKKYRKYILILSIIAGVFLTGFILNLENEDSSLIHRKHFFKIALEIIKDNPVFGVGPGHYKYYYYKYIKKAIKKSDAGFYLPPSYYVHNDYLQFFVEVGLISFFFLIIIMYRFYKNAHKNYFLYLFSFFSLMWVQHVIYFEQYIVIFIFILSTFIYKKQSINNNISIGLKILSIGLIIFNFCLLVGAYGFENEKNPEKMKTYTLFRPGYSFLYANIGSEFNNLKKYDKGKKYYHKALSIEKYWGTIYYHLATVLINTGEFDKGLKTYKKAVEFSNYEKAFEYSAEALFFAWKKRDIYWVTYFLEKVEEYKYSDKQKALVKKIKKKMEI
jgi:tetratricopeptide (TPR) repeat protein